MEIKKAMIVGLLIGTFVGIPVVRTVRLIHNPKLCVWPRVTICRGCEDPIYAWENYKRKSSPVVMKGGEGTIIVLAEGRSSLFHSDCPTRWDPITATLSP